MGGLRLSERAEVLVPARTAKGPQGRRRVDWTVAPAQVIPVRFAAQPQGGGPGEDASTVGPLEWRSFIPPLALDGTPLEGRLTSSCRIRWDGKTYEITRAIEPHRRRGGALRYYRTTIRRVTGSNA